MAKSKQGLQALSLLGQNNSKAGCSLTFILFPLLSLTQKEEKNCISQDFTRKIETTLNI